MSDELNVQELMDLKETMEGEVMKKQTLTVSCIPIKHYNGVAYRLEAEGKSVIYSGDMGYDENLSKLGKEADLAIVGGKGVGLIMKQGEIIKKLDEKDLLKEFIKEVSKFKR